MLGGEFLSHAGEHMGTLHVHERRGGKIEHHELRQFRRGADTTQDRIANIVDVKVDEGRFRPENHYFGDELIVLMSFAVGEATGAGNSPKHSDVWSRGCMDQLHKRDHRPDHHAEEQTKREYADESRYRHDKLRTMALPELLQG